MLKGVGGEVSWLKRKKRKQSVSRAEVGSFAILEEVISVADEVEQMQEALTLLTSANHSNSQHKQRISDLRAKVL